MVILVGSIVALSQYRTILVGKIKRAVLVGTSWSWVRAFAFAFVLGLLCLWWVGEGRLFGASANFF